MGFNVYLCDSSQAPEHTCPICLMIYADPMESRRCHHIFCRRCINEWLRDHEDCPYCRAPLGNYHLIPATDLRDRIYNLKVLCQFRDQGCQMEVDLKHFASHTSNCDHNPANVPIPCRYGCGAQLRRRDARYHKCIEYLHGLIEVGNSERQALASQVEDLKGVCTRKDGRIARLERSIEDRDKTIEHKNIQLKRLKREFASFRLSAAQLYAAAETLRNQEPCSSQRPRRRYRGNYSSSVSSWRK